MAMTREDFNLVAIALRETQPASGLQSVLSEKSDADLADLRVMCFQHKRICYKLALELDAQHVRFHISEFMEVCGYDDNGADGYVVAPCFSINKGQ